MSDMNLSLVRPQSLPERVADTIVDGVANGALAPGQRIVELELARELDVSRIPIREAIKTLLAQGILEASPHRGTRIVELDDEKIDQVCEVRAALEKIAAARAIKAYAQNPTKLERLEIAIDQMDWAV